MEIEFEISVCRFCLKNLGVIPLFKQHEEDIVAELISSIYNIDVTFDNILPDCVCLKCFENVKTAINMKETITNSQIMLKTYLEINKSKALSVEKHDNETTNKLIELSVEELEDRSSASEETLKCVSNKDLEYSQPIFASDVFNLYECEKCEFKTDTYKKVVFHMRSHPDVKLYECERCGKEFKARSRYVKHATIHRLDKPFECNICNKSFKAQLNLDQHLLIHKTERNIPCPNCEKTFCHMKGLRAHLLIHNEKNVACETCGKKFKHTTFLKIHIATTHANLIKIRVPCEICGKILSSNSLKNHINSKHGNGRFLCSHCDKSCSKSSLQQRMESHINTETSPLDPGAIELYLKYKCDECDKVFTSAISFKNHKIIHSGLKPFLCSHCGKEFAFKVYLERHIRSNHDKTNPKNFVCSICGKVSLDSSALKIHMLAHTGENPFHCIFCDSKFRYAKSLRIHISKKHKH